MNGSGRVALYSAVDDAVTHYEVDVDEATLTKRATIKAPSYVQEGWAHPSRRWLYLTTSNRGPGLKADSNHVAAYRIDESGALAPHGEPRPLPHRAVNMCVDPQGRYALNGHNLPRSGVTVHRIEPDGTLGAEVEQRVALDFGPYPHQVMMFPSGRFALIADRGNASHDGRPEDPGALRSFAFDEGALSHGQVVAPNGGYGFGPRHVDFHPSKPWLYVSDEKRNRLYLFRMPGDRMEAEPAYTCETLADPQNVRPRQLASTIHVHPNGRTVYVANRADSSVDYNGAKVFAGGENSIAVYAIDQATGEPTAIQHADTHSFHVRTFACDPSGRLMVTGSIKPHNVREGNEVKRVAAALSVFRIRDDGRLDFVRKYDVETREGQTHYWMGMVGVG
jgi:6-phosphogluconolactonase (cycloisomerase 2 family)